jgi:hypothetical protein
MLDLVNSGPLLTLAGTVNWSAGFLATVAIFGVLALALNLQWGYTGVFNFGVVAFFMVGAYTSALLTVDPPGDFENFIGGYELPVLVGWAAAAVAGGRSGCDATSSRLPRSASRRSCGASPTAPRASSTAREVSTASRASSPTWSTAQTTSGCCSRSRPRCSC